MKINNISVTVFSYKTSLVNDTDGHTHPGPEHDTEMGMLTIESNEGIEGICFGSPQILRPYLLENYIKKVLVGEDPFRFEKLWQSLARWQRGSGGLLSDKSIAVAEMALLDLIGKKLNTPIWKLLGGFRDEVPAYGSTMCGDEIKNGLSSPEDYGEFSLNLIKQGYKAIKLHTWMPPVSWAPNVKMDIKACAAVREAVGPDFPLMLDANHWYSRTEAFELGKGIEKLGYYWYEEPMDEHSYSSYKWLADNLSIPILGPEYAEGKFHTRAEWISNGVCDITRTGTMDVGGITPSIKIAHLAESFNMDCEIHGGGAGNLAVLGTISNARWYERGLLHPFIDYNIPPSYLNNIIDPMEDGMIRMPENPGLGEDINFDYINNNVIKKY
ncbi:MAG: enolase [Chloroflexi bacterium]|nr:enolase [Chloroflexota bacterium]